MPKRRHGLAGLIQMLKEREPHSRHSGNVRDFLPVEKAADSLGVVDLAVDHLRTGRRAAPGQAPVIGMEHRKERDRKSVVSGERVSVSVDLGGCSMITKKNTKKITNEIKYKTI